MQAAGVVLYPRHLSRTILIAVIVGSALFAINHLDTVLNGAATTTTWVKVGVTYLVPFVVSNVGLLVGTHRPRSAP
jgi:fatty-acid desaturase